MNSLGKILVVFVTASSLGFVAFTLSLVAGGPNWKSEMESEDLAQDFTFSAAAGERGPNYTAKIRKTEKAIGTPSRVLAEVLVEVRKKQVADAKDEETRLSNDVKRMEPMIKEIKELIPPDRAAMVLRTQMLDKTLTQISTEIQTVTQEIATKAAAIQQVQKTAQERRDEGFRLKNQLELMRTDLFVAQEQKRILEDELVRVEENLKRLERRGKQLQTQVEPYAN